MSKSIEISYYNAFILYGGSTAGKWHVEESRIKGAFNGKSVDYGARAYITDRDYTVRRRGNAMMYSGIYNDKTGVNNTNQFSVGESITKAVDASYGDIMVLHSEDTNLNIFQQNKVSAALIDKDAIFTAEGGALTVQGQQVIGQITPYAGEYGISDNPESFAYFGNRKYFVDRSRNSVMRLSTDGLTPISRYGMTDFFKDNLPKVTVENTIEIGRIYGMYDEVFDEYVVSMQHSSLTGGKKSQSTTPATTADNGFLTLGFSEASKGWVSFYSYKPAFGLSIIDQYFTFNDVDIYQHYRETDPIAKYNNYYDTTYNDPSYVTLIMNDSPSSIKTFMTINYEGSTGWSMDRAEAEDVYREGYTQETQKEEAYKIPKKGVTITDYNGTDTEIGFKLKESKYYADLKQKVPYSTSDYTTTFNANTLNTTLGIKGYHLELDMIYHEPTGNGVKAELFAVSNEIKI